MVAKPFLNLGRLQIFASMSGSSVVTLSLITNVGLSVNPGVKLFFVAFIVKQHINNLMGSFYFEGNMKWKAISRIWLNNLYVGPYAF